MAKFFVVGNATVDQMYFMDDFPAEGDQALSEMAAIQAGGAGGTIATALARLGNDVKLATRMGSGVFSELALHPARAAGVDESCIQHDPERRTSTIIILITPERSRTMIGFTGASDFLDVTQLDEAHVASCDALVMSAYSLIGTMQRDYALRALEIARANRLTIFVDMGSGAVKALGADIIELMGEIDYFLMNKKELLSLTGEASISEAVGWLAAQGLKHVVVKVGAMGSIIVTPENNELVDAFDVTHVADTTGAGDYYSAAFAHGIMQGHELAEAAHMGSIAGGLNATTLGAQSYELDAEELQRHLDALLARLEESFEA